MASIHEINFQQKLPALSQLEASRAFRSGRITESFNAIPSHELLVVKFAMENGSTETIILTRYVAERLRFVIERLSVLEWKPGALGGGFTFLGSSKRRILE